MITVGEICWVLVGGRDETPLRVVRGYVSERQLHLGDQLVRVRYDEDPGGGFDRNQLYHEHGVYRRRGEAEAQLALKLLEHG